ncbi:ZIP family metal transporter [Phytopseudomonas dryadis]|uniref:ZIP family metal transporter n=1 Tax=Phytopseudomonas dryadis TaxID=2487520 RepID=A0ABY1Z6X9_9GAMM|nr:MULTISPECIES: ZIP family metal transporter [Pseudomonas]TBV04097.1 ZIP family metal transporter [Pseudomonas dryadis]TBV17011.1 ZIP family metal transporter [Pseudomonas sp. FRB 230]
MSPLHELVAVNARSLRYALGVMLLVGGGTLLALKVWGGLQSRLAPELWYALQGGLLCALGTALGALPVLFMRSIPARVNDAMLGFGGGMMLAASCFSLLVPALQVTQEQGFGRWGGGFLVSAGLLLGASALFLLGRRLAHRSLAIGSSSPGVGVWLFVIAIVLHNIPEGMAVGVSAAAGLADADGLTLGIALQDVPEGLVIALLLAGAGMPRLKAVAFGAASGLVEPLFAILCAWLVGVSQHLLPWGLSLAAGAMIFVVVRAIIPELHRRDNVTLAILGFALGFCLMMLLDNALGRA